MKATERHEIAGTPRASERKFYRWQHGRAAGVPDDRRKARRRVVHGAASRAHNGGEAAHRGGDIRGEEKAGARVEGRQEGTTRRKGSACRSGVGAAPRACVYYIAAIYSIFIYILSIYL